MRWLTTPGCTAPRAGPLNQVYGEVGVAQLGDKVGGNDFPRAGSGITHHLVVLAVPNPRAVILVDNILALLVRHLYHRSNSTLGEGCHRTRPRLGLPASAAYQPAQVSSLAYATALHDSW